MSRSVKPDDRASITASPHDGSIATVPATERPARWLGLRRLVRFRLDDSDSSAPLTVRMRRVRILREPIGAATLGAVAGELAAVSVSIEDHSVCCR